MGGDLMDADPWCGHHPTGRPVIEPLIETTDQSISWSPEAERRLSRVPGFLRKMVRKRAEAHVRELGQSQVTTAHMATLAARRFGDNFPGKRPTDAATAETSATASGSPQQPPLAWTSEAERYLNELPSFLRDGIRQVAEEVAREEGRFEVNMKLIRRLEEEAEPAQALPWEGAAEQRLQELLADRPAQVLMFVQPSMQAAAEREARRRGANKVASVDVEQVIATDMAGVNWDSDALERVASAPDFIRGGIKKAAEFNARREGLDRIGSADLTRFRNRAMMRAVRRIKGFGLQELNFDAYEIAQQRVPRLKQNAQADKRFAEIRNYVESKRDANGGGLGLLDRALLDKMKAELKR